MKKLTTMIVTFLLCLAMSITVMAAGSPSVDNSGSKSPSADNAGSESPSVSNVKQTALTEAVLNQVQKEILADYFDEMEKIDADTTLTLAEKAAKKAEYVQEMINKVLGLKNSYKKGIYAAIDLQADDLSKAIKIDVSGVKAGDEVVVAHLTSEGVWENVKVEKVENDAVYAKFDSLSPVFVAVIEKKAGTDTSVKPSAPSDNQTTTDTTSVSPKTADSNIAVILLVAVAATVGAVVFARRRMNFTK